MRCCEQGHSVTRPRDGYSISKASVCKLRSRHSIIGESYSIHVYVDVGYSNDTGDGDAILLLDTEK